MRSILLSSLAIEEKETQINNSPIFSYIRDQCYKLRSTMTTDKLKLSSSIRNFRITFKVGLTNFKHVQNHMGLRAQIETQMGLTKQAQ